MRCGPCGTPHHPPGPRCPRCWSTEVTAEATAGEGTVELATVLHVGPAVDGIDYELGHTLVSVVLDGVAGVRVTAPIVGAAFDEVSTTGRAGRVGIGTVLGGRRVRHGVVERGGVPTLVFGLVPADEDAAEPGGVPSLDDGHLEPGEG